MNKTLKLSLTAMLTALSVVANFLTIPLAPNKFVSLTVVFTFVAAIYLGPLSSVIVGYFGDLIAHIINPLGPYNWFVALSCAICGLIVSLFYLLPIKRIWKLVISLAVYFVVCSAFLNTFGLWLYYIVGVDASPIGLWQYFKMGNIGIKKSFWAYLVGRLPTQLINLAVNGAIIAIIQQSKALDKLFGAISKRNAKTAETEENDEPNDLEIN